MTDPVMRDLESHIESIEAGDAEKEAVCQLAEMLERAAFQSMRNVMVFSVYETTAADMHDALNIDDEYFHKIAESLIKAAKRG
jgi:hypothetical protein